MNYTNLGNNIRKYRVEAKMSQTDLANKVGVTQQKVAAWEQGGNLQLETIEKIANGIGINPLKLFENVFEGEMKMKSFEEIEQLFLEEIKSGTISAKSKTYSQKTFYESENEFMATLEMFKGEIYVFALVIDGSSYSFKIENEEISSLPCSFRSDQEKRKILLLTNEFLDKIVKALQ